MNAFLRKLWECLTIWHLAETETDTADVIIAHAGGENTKGEPGLINAYLEKVVREIYARKPLPIVAQGELARCLTDLTLVGHIPRQAESSTYIDTVDVAKWHLAVCRENGWTKPILVSFQPHIWRAMMVCRKLGFEVQIPRVGEVYDRKCSQWWLRSPRLNNPRELACRIIWLVQGKI